MTAEPPTAILLVEGDVIVRHPLAEYLRSCGFEVLEAANGDEAKKLLTSPDTKIEVVLADMTTSGSGFELRRWVASEGLAVEVILAGSTETAVHKAGALCNEGPALAKPWDHRLVLEEIKRSLALRNNNKA